MSAIARMLMRACALLTLLLALLHGSACLAAPPALQVPDEPLGVPGAGLAPNFLLNFAVTWEDAGAAYREPYRAMRRYHGYFNPRLCYQYPLKGPDGTPDLDERSGYFTPAGATDNRHECQGAFSGNFLNWAATSTLDLLRLGLTGGDRVIDQPGLTVLQRAWLPDGAVHLDFYAHPDHFPRKLIPVGVGGSAPAAVTPFATERLYIVSCRNRLLFSNSADGGGCDAARLDRDGRRLTSDKFFGEFNARVQVCTPEDAALRPELCARYRDGHKPQGALHAAAHPVGIMGYLAEPEAPYGGLLRAPLKPLGPGDAPKANGRREWDGATGVLAANPDKAPGGSSGAINYINRLGRANPQRLGAYSVGDPGAELYYEALRYLQGRAATLASGAALDDGLPVWRTPPDPVAQACQRQVLATIGHAGFRHDRHLPGNTVTQGDLARAPDGFNPAAPFDVMRATRQVGLLEAASGPGAGDLGALDLRPYGPQRSGSYYIAGAAYWAHTTPIRPDKPVRVDSHALELGAPSSPPASPLYLAAKYGAFADRNADADPNRSSGPGGSEWQDEAGKPRHYHPARTPDDIIPAVRQLFGGAGAQGLRMGPSALGGTGTARFLIQAGYDAGQWSGTLQRRALRIGADGAVELDPTPSWDAALVLSGAGGARGTPPLPSPRERNIHTLLRGADGRERALPMRWAELPSHLQALFAGPGGPAAPDGLGEARVDYLRGERSRETAEGGMRRRAGVLGDIVRSVPLVVGAPSASVQGEGYAEFRERAAGRRSAVYVGANDGMLHAFDAATGRELFAYVPHALLATLPALTEPGYRHRPYVDGSPGQGEALLRGRWRSVLASGMGMGARGVFALDVTDPATFGAGGAGPLWEFTERDDSAMGHVHAPPQIARLNVAGKDGVPRYRYFVVVTSGINPAAQDGQGALFLLALDKGPDQAWQLGLNYYRFVTPAVDGNGANALSPAALAVGGDGAARTAYAGDLQGRLWRFDLGGGAPWGGTLTRPLFIARDAGGAVQPIAHAPALAFAPGGGYLVLFGTGKFIEPPDASAASFTPQSFYAVHDRLKPIEATLARAALAPRTLAGTGPYLIKGKPVSYAGEGATAGWYFDFANARADGERAAGPAVVRAGALVFDSLVLGGADCTPPERRSYLVDVLSGLALGHDGAVQADAVTGSLVASDGTPASLVLGPPLLLEVGGGSGPRTASGGATATRRYVFIRPGAAPGQAQGATIQQVNVAFGARRLSWRQVANWKDLYDKAKR